MKKFSLILIALLFSACTFGKIEPGHVGVVVPLSGDEKGTLETTQNGWYIYSFNTQVYEFPTFNQQHNWTNVDGEGDQKRNERIYFMDKTGQRVGADVGIQFHVPAGSVTKLFQTYRQPLDTVRDTVLKMSVRNALNKAASQFTAEDMFGEKRADFFNLALEQVRGEVSKNGLEIDNLYLNGELELPAAISQTITAKLQATMIAQQKENEKRAVEAEAAKVIAQAEGEAAARKAQAEGHAAAAVAEAQGEADSKILRAQAEAKANALLSQSLSGAVFELRKLEIQADVQKSFADAWGKGGAVPQTILPGQTGGFLMDIRGGFTKQQ